LIPTGSKTMAAEEDIGTRLIHHPYVPPSGFEAPQPGIHKASTVIFANTAAMRARSWQRRDGYTYGLHGTPTTFTLEERIATLEGARHCVLVPSGLAAIALVGTALLSPGDEVLLPANVYGPSREFARHELARWGITHRLYDPLDADALRSLIGPQTKLLWLEAAGSVTMEFPDLIGLIRVARQAALTIALDNTWGAGLAFAAFGLGIDVSAQALTKYPSGGGDVLMGSVCTRSDALHERIKLCHMRLGLGVAANDAEAILRGLPTMALRYADGDGKARALAHWLGTQPQVLRVLHPALAGSPGHEHWAAVTQQAAGLFSVLLHPRYTQAQVDGFVDALKRFRIGYSWAGPVSLVVPYDLAAIRPGQAIEGHLVRLSIGLEALADLQADLAQALQQLPV
jgi:cysteine-S-conjugate beta-lyase